MHSFDTPVPLFVGIVLVYLVGSLILGARQVYFEPLTSKPEDPEGTAKITPETIAPGAEPWKVGEKGGTSTGAKPPTESKDEH